MFSAKKTRRIYQSPHAKVAEVDLEGQLLTGSFKVATISEWDNVNADSGSNEVFYLESFDQ